MKRVAQSALFSCVIFGLFTTLPAYAQNHAPAATGTSLTTDEDVPLSGTLSASDAEGDSISFRVVTSPAHGSVVLSGAGAFSYAPVANYNGADSFTFVASDGSLDSTPATLSLTINPVNDAPVAENDFVFTDEDTALTGTLPVTDPDEHDTVTCRIVTKPTYGTVSILNGKIFKYTPSADFYGFDSFDYVANDGKIDSAAATILIIVDPVNDAPVAQNMTVAVQPGQTLTGQLLGFDVDLDSLVFSKNSGPSHGAVGIALDGHFSFTSPDPDFNGTVTFSFTVSDGPLTSSPATVTIKVGYDAVGFIADTLLSRVTSVDFPNGAGTPGFSQEAVAGTDTAILDEAVDRANRRLYALTAKALTIFEIETTASPPTLKFVATVAIPGTRLALSLDGRTGYVAGTGKVTAINLYPEMVFGNGQSIEHPPYTYRRDFPFPAGSVDLGNRPVAALAVHPAGDRLFVYIDMDPSGKKFNLNDDNAVLPGDFGFLTQLDISAEVQTEKTPRDPATFAPVVGVKDLISPTGKIAIGIKSLTFSPDGNCAFLAAVGGQILRATPFGILPGSDEGTGGIIVLDVRPAVAGEAWVRYLSFIPTTEKGEKTAELRQQIHEESVKIVHPEVQLARTQLSYATGAFELGNSSAAPRNFTSLPALTAFSVASEVLSTLEQSYADYGLMMAYASLYPRDMVGASSVAINHLGDFGIVTLQDTNNLGLLALEPSPAVEGYTTANRPDFYIKLGTGKSVNGLNIGSQFGLSESHLLQGFNGAYPQKAVLTSDDSRVYIGMSGGVPTADLSNRFGSADALILRTERDRPNSVFKTGNPPPGFSIFGGPALKSPRLAATLNAFDSDHDQLSDQLEAYNRWNALKTITYGEKAALISTVAGHVTDPGKPVIGTAGKVDALDYGYFLPSSGLGYRLNRFGLPPDSVSFGTKSVVTAIERLGQEWDRHYGEFLRTSIVDQATPITRPYFIVGLASQPGGGIIKTKTGEPLKYSEGNGLEADFPYLTLGSDAVHDFVASNGPGSPTDNSILNPDGFDVPHTRALLQLLLAEPLVETVELDPQVLEYLPDFKGDPRIVMHGSLTIPDSRRDLDNHLFVTFKGIPVDLDADSDNNHTVDQSPLEDRIENQPGAPGVSILPDNGDQDNDGIPNYADFDGHGPSFAQMPITIPDTLDLATLKFKVTYSESDPSAVGPPPEYLLPATGGYRVWTKDGSEFRQIAQLDAGGNFIESNTPYALNLLALTLTDHKWTGTLYIESANPSAVPGASQVAFTILFPTETEPQSSLHNTKDIVTVAPVRAALAVDADRDGHIKLSSEDNSDATSKDKPYRFWINDDIDRTHVVDDTDSEEDDISPTEAASHGWTADWQNDHIQSKRDLEDFSRLWLSTSGLNDAIKTGQLYLGLKWTNVTGTPAIKLYQSVASDGGTGYLTDDSAAQDQLDGILGVILSHAIPDERDNARDGVHTVIEGGDVFVLPTFLFAALTEAAPKTHLLFEGCKAGKGQLQLVILKKDGTAFTPIGEGPGIWLDLKKIGDMYEHWSVGNGSGDAPQAVASRVASATGSGSAFSYDASSPEERKYILFVHGWNMEKWEKERFAETAYKRLWWEGYKGRFGLFSWPTTNNFGSEMDAIIDSTNFDRGEFSGWRSATPLRQLMQTLNSAYGGELYVFSHSMGGVVTSEALRLQSDAGGGQITKVYVASQAALSAHSYDGTLSTATGSTNALQWDYNHPRIPNGTQNYGPATPNLYKNWMAFMLGGSATSSSSVGTLVNFYNENDWALSAPVWQFNQITKPDYTDLPSQPYQYYYTGDIETLPFDGFRKMLFTVADATSLAIGSRTALADRYEIMAFAAESRVKAFGATPNISQGITRAFNVRTIWPSDADNHSAHKWHSGEFRSTIQRQGNYWKAMLGQPGFQIPTVTLP